MSTTNENTMQDPGTEFPEAPQPEQQQSTPGTLAEMNPTPDHGEESYKALAN